MEILIRSNHLKQKKLLISITSLVFATSVKSGSTNKNPFITKVTKYLCQSRKGICITLLSHVTRV